MNLKKIDRQILYHLSADSSVSLTKLSKILKTSKQVISYNLSKLIESGIIRKFYPIVDYSMIDMMPVRVLLRLEHTDPKRENEIMEFIKSTGTVKSIQKVDDYFDIVAESVQKGTEQVYNFLVDLKEKFRDNIVETHTNLIAKKEFFAFAIFGEGRQLENHEFGYKKIVYSNHEKEIKLDETDRKILAELEKNSRTNKVILAQRLKLNPKTLIYRIKRMESQKIIVGYSILVDWKLLGQVHYKVLLDPCVHNNSEYEKLKEFLRKNRRVIGINKVISDNLIEFEIISENQNILLDFINILRTEFSGVIKTYDILYIREEM